MNWWTRKKPDIALLLQKKDVNGLISALQHSDFTIQWQAAEALGKMGQEGTDHLLAVLSHKNRDVKIGIIEALGEIKDPRTTPALIDLLKDKSVEVRWAAAIALGDIGDIRSIDPLIPILRDTDKYVRYGASLALERLGWQPENDTDRGFFYLGKEDWDRLGALGEVAIKPLTHALKDRHADVRSKAIEVIGRIGCDRGIPAVIQGLKDENPEVRWKAVLAGPKCGIPMMFLPRGLNKRPRIRKNPRIAAFLNFILPGQGYNYLGFWFGTLIFQLDVTFTLYMLSFEGEQVTYTFLLPLYALFAVHAWYIARRMPEL